jgi:uncharacterized membrane protein (DUF2068 family)
MTTVTGKAPPRFGLLRLIAVYKILKVALFLATAYGVLRMRDASVLAKLYEWVATLPSGKEHEWASKGLAWFSGQSPARIEAYGIVALCYAAIFTVEGIGLWMRKRWAEWLTIVVTSSLVPLEVWEVCHRATLGKAAVLVSNVAIVWYLIIQLRSSHGERAAS